MNIQEQGERFVLDVTARSFAKFVELDLKDADVVFSDNYFDLSAGDVKQVVVEKVDLPQSMTLEQLQGQLTVRSIFDTFE